MLGLLHDRLLGAHSQPQIRTGSVQSDPAVHDGSVARLYRGSELPGCLGLTRSLHMVQRATSDLLTQRYSQLQSQTEKTQIKLTRRLHRSPRTEIVTSHKCHL